MSANESGQHEAGTSSIELARNAKGDCQLKVKLYDGVDDAEVARLQSLAVKAYRDLEAEFYGMFPESNRRR